MPDRNESERWFALAGIVAGAAALGAVALLANESRKKRPKELEETVEELRSRADRILDELSEGIDTLISRARDADPHVPIGH